MKRFRYVISTKTGARKMGRINAPGKDVASHELSQKGYTVISLLEQKRLRNWFWEAPHLSLEEKVMFTKHLATMIRVGITITEAMDILAEQSTEKNNRIMFKNIIAMLQSGRTLSHSLSEYPKIFSDVYVKMIEAGEESGTLESTLDYLEVQLEKEYELHKSIVSAFIYPIIIVSITLLISLGIVIFLMPRIMKIFSSFDVDLPLPTRIMIDISTVMTEKPLLVLGVSVATFILFTSLFRWQRLKPFWHNVLLHIPVFGKLARFINLARFSRTLSSLFSAGIPLTRSLEIVKNTSANQVYREAIADVAKKVELGAPFGEAFQGKEKLFPPIMTKMFYIGERTGSLERTTQHLAILYERNVDSMTRNLTVLLEPILLVFMAVLVGGVAISIILPIYQLPNIIRK